MQKKDEFLQKHFNKKAKEYGTEIDTTSFEIIYNTIVVTCLNGIQIEYDCITSELRVFSPSNIQNHGDDQIVECGNEMLESNFITLSN